MIHRNSVRLVGALLSLVLVGCESDPKGLDPQPVFLEVTPNPASIDQGATATLTATIGGQPATVTWASSNTAVATVASSGPNTALVTSIAPGFTAITATLTSNTTQMRSANIDVAALQGIGLTNGVPVTGLSSSGARGSSVLYRIFVPAGKTGLTVTLDGNPTYTGDADIYVRRATPPTTSSFTCASEGGTGATEVCAIASPASGTWYILVALWDPYAGARLTATYTP